jgi:mannosylglycoprotein endo-beta-mannosidase
VTSQYLDGPYGICEPATFFDRTLGDPLRNTPFNPELGSVGTPVAESMLAMMPQSDARAIPQTDDAPGLGCDQKEVHADWTHHTYIPYCKDGADFMTPYRKPASLEEFCTLAQVLNYVQYKSLVEGYTQQMWSDAPDVLPIATGFVIWKTQNPWPGLRGSLYDWWLDQNGGYFGVKQATAPVHAQLDLATNEIVLVNTSRQARTIDFTATVCDLKGNTGSVVSGSANVSPMTYHRAGAAPNPGTAPVWFLRLDIDGQPSNFYWLHAPGGNYQELTTLPEAPVGARGTARIADGRCTASIQLVNGGQPVAFFLQLQVRDAGGTNRVLPVFYSDNYFSLLRGERRTIALDFAFVGNGRPQLWLEGWNAPRRRIEVTFDE